MRHDQPVLIQRHAQPWRGRDFHPAVGNLKRVFRRPLETRSAAGAFDAGAIKDRGGELLAGHVEQQAGQEAQGLAGLHCRTRENDAGDLLLLERGDRHGHREIRLAGAGGPDTEDQLVIGQHLEIA